MIKVLAAVILSAGFVANAQAAKVTILPGAGFSDATRISPVGGNTATTIGQARLQVFQRAADLWGAKLSSAQEIFVNAYFGEMSCSSNSGMLGWARPNVFIKNFMNAPQRDVYYPVAQANALAGNRVDGSNPIVDASSADIHAEFNSVVDSSSNCLNGVGYYYGLDNNAGNKVDLLNVVMHELAHGLGFLSFVDESSGRGGDWDSPDHLGTYDQFVFDELQGKYWPQMSAEQRVTSAVNDNRLVWNGVNVNGVAAGMSAGVTSARHLKLYAPTSSSPGVSVSHWDDSVPSSFLMRPRATTSMKASQGVDLTICAMADMGWPIAKGISCPDGSTSDSESGERLASTSKPGTESSSSSGGGGGSMPNLSWLLILLGFLKLKRIRAAAI